VQLPERVPECVDSVVSYAPDDAVDDNADVPLFGAFDDTFQSFAVAQQYGHLL